MRSMFLALAVLCILCFTPGVVAAQSNVYFPGSVWTSNGTLSPTEKGNVISFTHAEQGIAWHGLELFGQTTFSADSKGYDWNRRTINGGGVRFTQQIASHGMIRASYSYVRERRWTLEKVNQYPALAVEAWFGWNNSPRPAQLTK